MDALMEIVLPFMVKVPPPAQSPRSGSSWRVVGAWRDTTGRDAAAGGCASTAGRALGAGAGECVSLHAAARVASRAMDVTRSVFMGGPPWWLSTGRVRQRPR